MGSKRSRLSARRKSMKWGWRKRRQEMRNKAQAENAKNETNIQLSIKSVSDINSEVENGILHCVNQIKEEEADDNEKSIEAYEEESICNGNFEYCKDKDNLVVDSQYVLDNEERIELYEEHIEVYKEEISTYSEKVENGILHFVNQVKEEKADDNEKSIEAYEEESICNGHFEYCKDKDNLVVDSQYVLDNEEKVELYEEYIEVYEEEISTYNENIENCEDQEDLIIDNNCLSDRINSIPKNIPEGRYIVDISFMWNEIHRIFDDHAQGIECQFKYWQLVNFRRRGLLTQLFFKCQMCNYEASFWTEPMDSEKSDINAAAVAGCVEVGIGYTQMKKLCTAMNIKYMSEVTYIKNRDHKKSSEQY